MSNFLKSINKFVMAIENFRYPRIVDSSSSVIFVAHCDDEMYFFSKYLSENPKTLIVIATYSNATRWVIARIVTAFRGGRIVFLGLEDSSNGFSVSSESLIKTRIEEILVSTSGPAIVQTHSQSGEYGHIQHQQLNNIVRSSISNLGPRNQLLTPVLTSEPQTLDKKTSFGTWLYGNLTNLSSRGKISNRLHAKRAKYFVAGSTDETKPMTPFQWFNWQSAREAHKESIQEGLTYVRQVAPGYLELPDRHFLLNRLLPSLTGDVLNVGIHAHNKFDYKFLDPREANYFSCDIDPEAEQFAQAHNHFTIDVSSSLRELPQFDHIILMGVIGWAPNVFGQELEIIENLTGKIRSGGTITLGIHLGGLKWLPSRFKIFKKRRWIRLILSSTVAANYVLLDYVAGHNLIFVLRKISYDLS